MDISVILSLLADLQTTILKLRTEVARLQKENAELKAKPES